MGPRPSPTVGEQTPDLAGVMDRNIRAMLARRQAEERRMPLEERVALAVTRFAGSMRFVYLHIVVYGLWVVVNLSWLPVVRPFDPTFVILATTASVEAIFLSTFVLISQNRMAAVADRREDLDLQVDLLAEHEITRLIKLVAAVARKVGVEEADDPELSELLRDVAPERVLDALERHEQQLDRECDGEPG